MVAPQLVPTLVIASPVETERLLPDAAEGEVEVYAGNDGFEAYGYAAGGHYWAHLPGLASFRFLDADSRVVAVPEVDVSAELVEDAYRRNVLPLVLQLRGREVLHASAVRTPGGLVVFCGVSGAGKSTFASGLSRRGHPVWADDAVVFDVDGEEAVALQVPFRLGLPGAMTTSRPHPAVGSEIAGESVPILALLVLGRLDASDEPLLDFARLEPTSAFTALVPHAYCFRLSDAARKGLMLDRYLRLASLVATFDVRYRADIDRLDAVLDDIESRVLAGVA